MTTRRLESADGLTLTAERDGQLRVRWQGADWLGPVRAFSAGQGDNPKNPDAGATLAMDIVDENNGADDLGPFTAWELSCAAVSLPVTTSVRAYRDQPLLVFRAEATRVIEDLVARVGSPTFERPSLAWPAAVPIAREPAGLSGHARAFGYQYTEFAYPAVSDASLASFSFFLAPYRPRVVQPLWFADVDGRCVLLAPHDHFHEQIIAVPASKELAHAGLRCGWHGDLERIPAGFATELGLWAGTSPRRVLRDWGGFLRGKHGTDERDPLGDRVLSRLSYWTDNGSAYWYRTAPGLDLPTTLEKTSASLRERDIPVDAFELDSWFYPHAITRPVDADGQALVPPTGMLAWKPRPDVLPDGVSSLRERLGNPPLILHSRHISSQSQYVDKYPCWIDGARAHPQGPELFEEMFDDAREWGAVQYEQDWLVESYFGVRGLRAEPGRARSWRLALDRAATSRDMTLLWCMATPADFCQTVELRAISSIRTSNDYRYLVGSGSLWWWFLQTNALARALGLPAFKDVFLSKRQGQGLDGDPHAEFEALLAALSAGPVGLGDRMERFDREIIMRTCRSDGILMKADVAVAAIDACLGIDAMRSDQLLIAETYSDHPAGRWLYLVAVNIRADDDPQSGAMHPGELGIAPVDRALVYNWKTGQHSHLQPSGEYRVRLASHEFDYRIICPVLPGDICVFGDTARYAAVASTRLGIDCDGDAVVLQVRGAPAEVITIRGWSSSPLAAHSPFGRVTVERDASTEQWCLCVVIDDSGAQQTIHLRRANR